MQDLRPLTEREMEILVLVVTGVSNREIGQTLHISANTVKVHLSNIFQKLGVASRTEATLYAIQAGWVEGVGSSAVPPAQPWWRRGWVIAGGALVIALVAIMAGALLNPGEPPPENVVDLEQLERERWQELAPMPTARKGLAVAAYDGKIYAIAGETEDGVSDVVERYDPVTDTWETLPPKPTAVTDVQAAVIGGKIYVPGGRQASGEDADLLEVYDPRTGIWELATSIPQPLSRYAIGIYEGRLFLFGGMLGNAMQTSVWSYVADRANWERGEAMPRAHTGAGTATVSGGILVGGGEIESGIISQVQLYHPDQEGIRAMAWSDLPELPYIGTDLNAVSFGEIVYLLGGSDSQGHLIIQEFIFPNDNWQALATPFDFSWVEPRVTQLGNDLFVIGGLIDAGITGRMVRYKAVYTVLIPIIQ